MRSVVSMAGGVAAEAKMLVKLAVTDRRALRRRTTGHLLSARFSVRSRSSRQPVTGDAPVDVCLTTYGDRVRTVHLAIESIAAGRVRPARLILWLDDRSLVDDPPPHLRALVARGLEVLHCRDWGPHKKQYPYATGEARGARRTFVTADDDVYYPSGWLAELVAAHEATPDVVVGQRAHRLTMDGGQIAPYETWPAVSEPDAALAVFSTGVAGVLYPPTIADALRDEGDRFLTLAARADDVWVHSVAVRHGIRSRQVSARSQEYTLIPGSQKGALFASNVLANDAYLAACYGAAELHALAAETASPGVRDD